MENSVGQRIKIIRNSHNLSQKFVADLFKIHRSNYSKIEKDTQKITPEQIKVFCEYFNVSADFLLDIQVDNKLVYDFETVKKLNKTIQELSIIFRQKN